MDEVSRRAVPARGARTANGMMTLWLRSYIVGITDGRPIALPTFSA